MKQLMKQQFYIFSTAILFITSFILNANAANEWKLTMENMDSWLKSYEQAWEQRDADKVVLLFTEDASYQEDPYKEPFKGRAEIHNYWSTVTQDQSDVKFTYEILSIAGNTGIAHWHSEFVQTTTGSTIILDGIFVLKFSNDGLCQSLREWWHFKSVAPEDKQ